MKKYLSLFSIALVMILSLNIRTIYSINSSIVIQSVGTIDYQQTLLWLHTEGSSIKNANGEVFIFKGAAWMEGAFMDQLAGQTPDERAERMKELGVNSVRVCLDWRRWPGQAAFSDECVNALTSRGIYVILDQHEGYGIRLDEVLNDPTEYVNWMKDLALRYVDNSGVVAIGLWNEPAFNSPQRTIEQMKTDLYDFFLLVSQEIHSVNPNLLCLIPSPEEIPSGNFKVMDVYYDNPYTEPNVVYVWHKYLRFSSDFAFYQSYINGNFVLAKEQLESFYNYMGLRMLTKNVPVFDEEFGADEPSDPDWWPIWLQDHYDILSSYGVGWNQWVWYYDTWGLCTDDWTTLSPEGVIWAQNLDG